MGSPPVAAADATTSRGGGGGGSSEQGKLFVGGISWETTGGVLREYFGKYGEVTEASVVRDKLTGNARGFGFVSFSDPASAEMTIKDNGVKHVILGRTVEVKKARSRGERHQIHQYHNDNLCQNRDLSKSNGRSTESVQAGPKKIFVGGLSSDLTGDEFRRYFEKFGRITDVVVMHDNVTRRPRGFGFITFETEESVANAMQTTFHELNGKSVEVKRAVPKECNHSNNSIWSINNSNNGNPYISRMGNGTQSVYGNYPGGIYPDYSHTYEKFQGYGRPPISGYDYGAGFYLGGYISGGYGGMAYGAPYLGSLWRDPGFMGVRQSPVPYFNAGLYHGPYMGMETDGYYGFVAPTNVKLNQKDSGLQTSVVNNSTPSQDKDEKLDSQ